ncbi:hypothetical protein RHAL1_00398 [Beijerinckiaceae bacterium RH AL1]|nr:DUF2852 domain-containing protein [Beijerinckiaceae bacterium]VVB42808.1 hypothetical protein RHAL8_00374 [Beijerinckiaceae bacterium RH AL8]VVB42819.1 hypothetical protein RHCH11_RHCH11_00376 [Beijerinckiaceae bacterium RH CH11]VVC53517.1 hypothetical protein RHAL1_00398 [Beijerinckiaceae bacterium RH AL1]
MGGWGNATRQAGWNQSGWCRGGWAEVRRDKDMQPHAAVGRWTALDVALTIGTFLLSWQVGVAFIALKLWHQASGFDGSVLAFAADRWDMLVRAARRLLTGASLPVPFASRSSGNLAFDAWRQTELQRIEAERNKLRAAEREFAAYRDELLHAKDREDFDRFMKSRDASPG